MRQTLVKIAIFSSGRGNSARSSPDRCRKISWRVVTSTIILLVALGAQMFVRAHAAFMIHAGSSSVRSKMPISRSTKPNRRPYQNTMVEPWFLWVWFNHMVNYGKTVWLTMIDHIVEPYSKTMVQPWFSGGTVQPYGKPWSSMVNDIDHTVLTVVNHMIKPYPPWFNHGIFW